MVDLTGKTALVTGGARGQGRSHALALAQAGASVAILDVCEDLENVSYPLASQADMDETMRLINEANGKALAVKADVRDREAISDAVARIVDTFGSLDILAINHGVMAISEFRHMDPADWDVVIDINLNGVFNVLHAGLPHLLNQTWGRVIITSSMAGKGGYPQFSHYSASKWAVIGLAKTVALEVATTGTTVNVICPCCVDTPIIHNSTMYRLFRPDLDSPDNRRRRRRILSVSAPGNSMDSPSGNHGRTDVPGLRWCETHDRRDPLRRGRPERQRCGITSPPTSYVRVTYHGAVSQPGRAGSAVQPRRLPGRTC